MLSKTWYISIPTAAGRRRYSEVGCYWRIGSIDGCKEAILPVPVAAIPMEGLELVQLYTVPGTAPVKLMAAVLVVAHTAWLAMVFTVGKGVIVIATLPVMAVVQPRL